MVNYDRSYQLGNGQGSTRLAVKRIIIAHSTANPDATGKNEAIYMHGHFGNAYTHAIADIDRVYIIGEPPYIAWGAGVNANPYSPFQIELAEYTDKTKALAAYKNYISAIREYAVKYDIPLNLDDGNTKGIKTHKWVSANYGGTDHQDPYAYLAGIGINQAQFAADIKNGIGSTAAKPTVPAKPAPKPASTSNTIYSLHVLGESWLADVTNANNSNSEGFAGLPNHQHDLLTLKLSTGGKYRVHILGGGWLPWVTGSNKNDTVNGCAGLPGKAIDGVQISANGKTVNYRSQTTMRSGWLDTVRNLNDYAGLYGEPLDRLQVWFQ